ncbi:hypothetical protein COY27_05515 [Candidatus Woesearchaeota archaeon CG_4_10_14_0_2_um_filter_33_13]|nr:MAG: hypothetical protein COY27_05515 [Candidatus Woesearchaeota archaeon CG_4_10_14_0_2_um_filter_33_13]
MEDYFIMFVNRFLELLKSPSTHSEMFWIIIPLVMVMALMTIYFSKYTDEELGWNTALGNSLILIFVSMNLFREIFESTTPGSVQNFVDFGGATILVTLLLVVGLILLFMNFSHFVPKKTAYIISSPLAINLVSYVTIAIIYSHVPIDTITILAAILLLVVLFLIFTGIGLLTKKWWARLANLKSKEKIEDIKKEKKVLEKNKEIVKEEEQRIDNAVKQGVKEVEQKKNELKEIKKVLNRNNHMIRNKIKTQNRLKKIIKKNKVYLF